MSLAIPFFFLPIVIEFYGPEGYGEIIYFQSVFLLISIVVSFGFNISGIEILTKSDNVEISTIDIYLIKMILAFLMIIISFALVNFSDKNSILFYLSSWVLISEASNVQFYFQFKAKLGIYTLLNVVSKAFPFILFLIIKQYDGSLYVYPLSFMIMAIFVNLIVVTYLVSNLGNNYIFNSREIRKKVNSSFSVFKVSIVGYIYSSSGRVLLGFFSTTGNVAIYDLADRLYQVLKLPIGILTQTFLVDAAKHQKSDLTRRSITLGLIYGIIAILGVYFFGEYFINYLSKGLLLESHVILLVLALTLIPVTVSGSISSLNFVIKGKADDIYKRSLMVLGIFLFFAFFLLSLSVLTTMSLALLILFIEIIYAFLIILLNQKEQRNLGTYDINRKSH